MPEIKHNFTGGKMEKDLDERLIPNGQYRDAMNIQVSTSEGSEVGTIQNILGNSIIPGQDFINDNSFCVGSIADEKNDKLYLLVKSKSEELIINGDFNYGIDNWVYSSSAIQPVFKNTYVRIEVDTSMTYESGGVLNPWFRQPYQYVNDDEYTVSFRARGSVAGNKIILKDYGTGGSAALNEAVELTTSWQTYSFTFTANQYSDQVGFYKYTNADWHYDIDEVSLTQNKFNADRIIEYSSKENSITPVLVDLSGSILQFDSSRLITGINIIDDLLFWTDNYSEPKKINIPRCIEGTDVRGMSQTRLINEAQGFDINSNVLLKEEHITVIKKSPTTAPTIELITERDPDKTYTGVMRITTDPGGLVEDGDNYSNVSSMWVASNSGTNHLHDFSTLGVGSRFSTNIETDINGESGFTLDWAYGDTVFLKEFDSETGNPPKTPITDYTIKAKIKSSGFNNFSDTLSNSAPNGEFLIPDTSGTKPQGYDWADTAFSYNSYNQRIEAINAAGADLNGDGTLLARVKSDTQPYGFAEGGRYKVRFNLSNFTQGKIRFIITGNNGFTDVTTPSPVGNFPVWKTPVLSSGDNGIKEYEITLNTSDPYCYQDTSDYDGLARRHLFEASSVAVGVETGEGTQYEYEGFSGNINWVSIERLDSPNAAVTLEILDINNTPPLAPVESAELKYAIDKLDEEEKLFEFKFPRFAYRYQYEDREYSTFSPFSDVAFLPGSFDYHPQKGYNLGMTNSVNEIKIKNFTDHAPDDVVAIDLLYKDDSSPNIYVLDTVKKNHSSGDIWGNNEYTVNSELVKETLPSNQILRPWDAVPKKALAQEVTGNRIIYGNYTQGFDLTHSSGEYYPKFDVSVISDSVGVNTVKSIKSLREYQLGVVFGDKYGRETPVLSNASGYQKLSKTKADKNNKIKVSFADGKIPSDMEYFKFFIKETSGEYYNMAMDRWWDADDGNAWLSFPSSDRGKVDIDAFLILKKGVGSNDLVKSSAKYKVLAIENEAPEHIKTKKVLIEKQPHYLATRNVFNDTIDSAPLIGRDSFKMNYSAFSGTGRELHKITDGTLYIEFTMGEDATSKRYRITTLSSNINDSGITTSTAEYSVRLEEQLGDDVNFICNDPISGLNPTKIRDGAVVKIYKYTTENMSMFDGRFFVKIVNNEVFNANIALQTGKSTQYRTALSKKLYYMKGSDFSATHSNLLLFGDLSDKLGNLQGHGAYRYSFGRYAAFFRNYNKNRSDYYALNSEWSSTGNQYHQDIGQYQFDDAPLAKWAGEFFYHTASNAMRWDPDGVNKNYSWWVNADGLGLVNEVNENDLFNNMYSVTTNEGDVKDADDSGWSDVERYGEFNSDGEQEKGHVWFIDAGKYVGTQWGTTLNWPWVDQDDGTSSGLQSGSGSFGSIEIAMGGIYNKKLNIASDKKTEHFFAIGKDESEAHYKDANTRRLVEKLAPAIKFRFREDPTGEVYSFATSNTYRSRLRWSDGGHQDETTGGTSSGNWPAYSDSVNGTINDSKIPQLSPNFTRGIKSWFYSDRTKDGTMPWDPTNGGAYGPIQGGLRLAVTTSAGALPSKGDGEPPYISVFIDQIDDIICSVHNKPYSITKGMILTSYNDGQVVLDGSTTNWNQSSAVSKDRLIISDITKQNNGTFLIKLTGYRRVLTDATHNSHYTKFIKHIAHDTAIAASKELIFQQPAMNGYSQYSVNRINANDTQNKGWTIDNPCILAVGYNIEFLEAIDLDVGELPNNPAIWETEPKESTDLDIYYEASGNNPISITQKTKHAAIPVMSKVECTSKPYAKLGSPVVTSVEYSPLSSGSGISGSGDWCLHMKDYRDASSPDFGFLVGAGYVRIDDNLKITKPDGTIIEVRVTGWDAARGNPLNPGTFDGTYPSPTSIIYISENLHKSSTKYTLNWHNCFSFGNGVESNRIRDNFNLPYITNGVKASTTLDEHPYEEQLKYGLIYSGIYHGSIGVNNLNQFIAAEKITKDINPTYGSIQKLKAGWGQSGDLIALCEDRVLKIMANKDAIYNADGNLQVVATQNVLGQTIPYSGEFGISKNPESFASEAYRAYFTDKVRGSVMRLSMDGLTSISDHGMRDWFRDNLSLGTTNLLGENNLDSSSEWDISATNNISISGGEAIIGSYNTDIHDSRYGKQGQLIKRNVLELDKKYRLQFTIAEHSGLAKESDGDNSKVVINNAPLGNGWSGISIDESDIEGKHVDFTWVARRKDLFLIQSQINQNSFNYSGETIQDWVNAARIANDPTVDSGIGAVLTSTLTDGGAGYAVASDIATIGGSGTGFKINIEAVSLNNAIASYSVSAPGTGYVPGEIIEVADEVGSELIVDNEFPDDTNWGAGTGIYDEYENDEGVEISTLGNGESHQFGGYSQNNINLVDGEFYKIEYDCLSIDEGGDPSSAIKFILMGGTGTDGSYRPLINGGPSMAVGKNAYYFQFDKSSNVDTIEQVPSTTMKLYIQMTNGDQYSKSIQLKSVSLKLANAKITVDTTGGDGIPDGNDYGSRHWLYGGIVKIKDIILEEVKEDLKLIGSYDDRQEEYNLTIHGENSKTISFKENTKGWVSFKSFISENALSCANDYYTVKDGKLWQHHNPGVNRNTFYGEFANSSFNTILNDGPGSIKSFHTLGYEGSQSRVEENTTILDDGTSDNNYYNLNSKTGWYVSSVETDKQKGSLNEFIEKEGKWSNYIKGIDSDITSESDFGASDIQGLGKTSDVIYGAIYNGTGETEYWMKFSGSINASLQVGDILYYQNSITTTGGFDVVDSDDIIKYAQVKYVYPGEDFIHINKNIFDGPNLIPDPGFETQGAWTTASGNNGTVVSSAIDTFISKSGGSSWKLEVDGNVVNAGVVTPHIPVEPNTIYKFSYWAYAPSANDRKWMNISLAAGNSWVLVGGLNSYTGTNIPADTWTEVVGYFETASSGSTIKVKLGNGGAAGSNGDLRYFDNVSMVKVGTPPPDPSLGDFIMFAKNNVVNTSSLVGYFADVKLENNSRVKAELFAVSSEITESSK